MTGFWWIPVPMRISTRPETTPTAGPTGEDSARPTLAEATTGDNASDTRQFGGRALEHVAVILVTGMSGTGKSTALNLLEQRGYRVVDTDVGEWIEHLPHPDGTGVERQWREDRIDALITEHEHSGKPLFIAGTVWNQGRFHTRFDEIVLLSAPIAVMLERIAHRDTNPFGKTAEQRDQIQADTTEIEPLLRSSATMEIDTRTPPTEVVDQLAALAGPPPSNP